MTRIVLTVSLVALFLAAGGCGDVEKYANIKPTSTPAAQPGSAPTSERDILEQLAVNRQAYTESLQQLINYYSTGGNEMKLKWAKRELANVMALPQFTYVVEAQVAGPELRATESIPAADQLFEDAVATDKRARFGRPVTVDKQILRLAVEKYNQLIRQYPTSNKIGEAAYNAGEDYEIFEEYAIAAVYFERAAQWDPGIKHPTRFKAAYIYDRFLHDRQKALMLYQESLAKESGYKAYSEKRVLELTKKEVPQ